MNAPMQKRTMSGIQEYSTDVEEIKAWAIKEMDAYWAIKSRSIPDENKAVGQKRYEAMKAAVLAHTDPAWWREQVRLCDVSHQSAGELWLKAGQK